MISDVDWGDDYDTKKEASQELVVVEVEEVVTQTDKAWLIQHSGGKRDWFPMSVCELGPRRNYIMVPLWLAEMKEANYNV